MKVTVEYAARLLGVPQQFIRKGIQTRRLDFGECAKIGRYGKNYYYVIFHDKLAKYLGISNEELDERLMDIEYIKEKYKRDKKARLERERQEV